MVREGTYNTQIVNGKLYPFLILKVLNYKILWAVCYILKHNPLNIIPNSFLYKIIVKLF